MLLIAVYLTMAVAAAIGITIVVLRNKDILFPKHQNNNSSQEDK